MKFNKVQIKSLIIAPSIAGFLSSCASITLIVSILQSNQKLSTVYRRLIFVLSVFDIIQSIPQFLSSLPIPAGTIWGAIGNDTTCALQGFFIVIGTCGAVLYSLSLTIYFLLVVKFDMSEAKIKKFAEPFLHVVPIVYSFTVSAYVYATNNYNPSGSICYIASKASNCGDASDIQCQSQGSIGLLLWIGGGFPIVLAFVGNCTILAVIWWKYRSQSRKNQAYARSFEQSSTPRSELQSDEEEQTEPLGKCCPFCPIKQFLAFTNKNTTSTSGVLAAYLSRPSRTSVRRMEEMSKRAAAYVAAFLLSFVFCFAYRLVAEYGNVFSFTLYLMSRIFYPFQGFFNVLVYTYPHVMTYRRNHTECNWFQAFWNVIRTGGDNDQLRVRGRASIRQMQRVLAQSEYNSITPR